MAHRSRARAALRTAACASASALLLAALGPATARAAAPAAPAAPAAAAAPGKPADPIPTPSLEAPGTPAPPPGADDPTTIPTADPALPGEGGPATPRYSEPPDNLGGGSEPPAKIDAHAPGLMLAEGAELAPARVLDIKFVTEDIGGAERREDSTVKTKLTLQAEVLFDKDSARLNAGAAARIAEIANEVEAQGADEVNVFGFTDDLGSYAHGRTLSRARADAVQRKLATALGADVTFHVRGYSEDYPIADNRTEAGRKQNRRVEVSFAKKD